MASDTPSRSAPSRGADADGSRGERAAERARPLANERTVTRDPFTFPARDGYVLRGTAYTRTGGMQVGTRSGDEPHRAPNSYPHPFMSGNVQDPEVTIDLTDGARPLPFRRRDRRGTVTASSRWPTPDRTEPPHSHGVIVLSGATAVPHKFYGRFASALAEAGYTIVTYDYRGVGGSKPRDLKTLDATMTDWALLDMAAAVAWARDNYPTDRLFLIGHSFGGQVAGLLDDSDPIRAMATIAAQSGYWKLIGSDERRSVGFHVRVTLPLTSRIYGYAPWSRFGSGEDIPRGVALQWARWCRDPDYLFGDDSLPLERYASFTAPVRAHSFGDDPWATPQAVDALMRAYPNVERVHIDPANVGIDAIGHLGYFREPARPLWQRLIDWFDTIGSGT